MHRLERAFERDRALSNELLDDIVRSTYLYAIRLAATKRIKTRAGVIVDISGCLRPYRAWLNDKMQLLSEAGWSFTNEQAKSGTGCRYWHGCWHRQDLCEFYPILASKLRETLKLLSLAHPQIDAFSLEDALAHKQLGLALGGGGGTGFAHQSLFQCLETAGIRPAIMTGTSIGALMGLIRAIQDHYDAASTILRLPSWWKLTRLISPCFSTTHGLPGLWRIDFHKLVKDVVREFGMSEVPRFSELRIPFACVTSGITRDPDIISQFELPSHGVASSVFGWTKRASKSAWNQADQIAHMLTSNDVVKEVTLGFDALTRELDAADGTAFSALVPGVLNYEVPRYHYNSREILDALFEREGLYRCADGGLTSNVPVRTLQREIDNLRVGHTNVYVIGVDVFAPQLNDGVFYPLEQIANNNAEVDALEADAFLRLKHLLSPMNLSPTLSQFKWLNDHFAEEFSTELKVIQYVLKPLRPIPMLDLVGR